MVSCPHCTIPLYLQIICEPFNNFTNQAWHHVRSRDLQSQIESRSLNNNNNNNINNRIVKDYDFIMWDIIKKSCEFWKEKKKKRKRRNKDNVRVKEKNKKYMYVGFTDWKTSFVLKITSKFR